MPYPGYGFLSENADFAEKQNKIIFHWSKLSICYGDKLAAKEAVKKYNIPWFPD
jgi:acetyl/propionyl-CoA carboxylase alpha subunit